VRIVRNCFWPQRNILTDSDDRRAVRDTLDTGNLSVCERSHFVVSNVQQLSTNPEKWLHQFPRTSSI